MMKIQGKKSSRAWGMVCGIVAAVCYGTNPLGALKLYAEGMSTGSVLFYRFGLAWIIMSVVLLFRHETLKVSLHELKVLLGLGLLFTISSLTLYLSFRVMDAGVASTILFTYPVMTAVIMALFFHERLNWVTGVSIALSFLGVALLYRGDGQVVLPWVGVVLVLLSALSYAVYIVVVNRSKIKLSPFKINFYVLLCCALGGRLHVTETGVGLLPGGLGLLINGTGYLASGHTGVLSARGNAILRILRLHGGLCGIADPALLGDKIDKTETPHSPGNEAGQSEAQDNANPARIAVRTG